MSDLSDYRKMVERGRDKSIAEIHAENSFAKLFSEIKIEKEITFREIGEKLNLSIGYLNDVAKGRKKPPEMPVIRQIEEILGVTDRSLQIAAVQSRKPTYAELGAEIKLLREQLKARDELISIVKKYADVGCSWRTVARALKKFEKIESLKEK